MTPDGPNDAHKGIDRELKRGSLELIVLSMLSSSDAYGLELLTRLAAQTNGVLEITTATLYPVLYRLESAGWVTTRLELGNRLGPPRKYYGLTAAGRRELTRLTGEWTTFSAAMAQLIRQNQENQ